MLLTSKRESGSRRVQTVVRGSRTEQSHRKACNINTIMKRFRKTGALPPVAGNEPVYGDFSGTEDFQSAQNRIIEAQEQFDALPSHIRTRFGNDPGQLLDFLAVPENLDAAVELGLVSLPVVDDSIEPDKAPEASPEPPTPPPG